MDPKFLFHHGVLDLDFVLHRDPMYLGSCTWILEILDPKFLFCHGILVVLDHDEAVFT